MADSFRVRSPRVAVLSLLCALLALGLGSSPGVAAGTPFHATYDETTTPRTCPPGAPPKAFCYTGIGTGPTTPPGGSGTERFAGFVDLGKADALHCSPDFNAVSITTDSGTLFLTTQGNACPTSTIVTEDHGTWQALGGTGIFESASGAGDVLTVGIFNANGTITSTSTYTGTLNLK